VYNKRDVRTYVYYYLVGVVSTGTTWILRRCGHVPPRSEKTRTSKHTRRKTSKRFCNPSDSFRITRARSPLLRLPSGCYHYAIRSGPPPPPPRQTSVSDYRAVFWNRLRTTTRGHVNRYREFLKMVRKNRWYTLYTFVVGKFLGFFFCSIMNMQRRHRWMTFIDYQLSPNNRTVLDSNTGIAKKKNETRFPKK